uniref:Uncharacterized protein n=1 Tax=Rhizophora mucronata TaxID=61149 RepID=A0A2P2MZ62_RHIMU
MRKLFLSMSFMIVLVFNFYFTFWAYRTFSLS